MKMLMVAAGLLAGCVYDSSDRCGPAMRFDSANNVCVCEDNAISTGLGCTPCAADEVVVSGTCACPAGSTKTSENVCEHVAGLGDACTDTSSCTNETYSVCAPATAGSTASTCTSACASDADCSSSYTCATWETSPYCRTFSGMGKSCASDADCEGMDATYCDTFVSHTCVVASCSLTANDCPRGLTCCSYANYGLPNLCSEACQ